jgi:hypothetical protein
MSNNYLDFANHAKALGLKLTEQPTYVLAFVMRDGTGAFQIMFKYDVSQPNPSVQMQYFITDKPYHIKLTLAQFLDLTPKKLVHLRLVNQHAIDFVVKVKEELAVIPKVQKTNLIGIITRKE